MKAYIINIKILGSKPLIWRRVIMPAGATFNRLNDVIQNTTNFLSGYPYDSYHLFEFDLKDLIVTNDDNAYLEHKHYINNQAFFSDRLKNASKDDLKYEEFYQASLKKPVRKPTSLKIDKYLEDLKQITYKYDYGDNWEFLIELEEIVDDYYFGFPTLIDGANTAPPEDVGGLDGFYDFLKVYEDRSHPEHKAAVAWADALYFRQYNPLWINSNLKSLKYKKTEWDKINHDNYKIIDDKYVMN